MLVLIVVAAATAFSFFVASYQQQLQNQENASHLRNLEAINVLSVETTSVGGGSTSFATMVVTIGSGDVNTMWITDLLVDKNVVVSYYAQIVQNGWSGYIGVLSGDSNNSLGLPPLDQAVLTLNISAADCPGASSPTCSFFSPSEIPTSNTYLELQLFTQRGSLFSAVYVPPTALISVSYLQQGGGGTPTIEIPVLDGTRSFQAGENATIVEWTWTVTNQTTGHTWPAIGAEVQLTNLTDPADNYSAVLTVYNSIGLFGVGVSVTFGG